MTAPALRIHPIIQISGGWMSDILLLNSLNVRCDVLSSWLINYCSDMSAVVDV